MSRHWGRVMAYATVAATLAACATLNGPATNPAIDVPDDQLAGSWREPAGGGVLILETDGRFTAAGMPDAVSAVYPSLLTDSGRPFHRPTANGDWRADRGDPDYTLIVLEIQRWRKRR